MSRLPLNFPFIHFINCCYFSKISVISKQVNSWFYFTIIQIYGRFKSLKLFDFIECSNLAWSFPLKYICYDYSMIYLFLSSISLQTVFSFSKYQNHIKIYWNLVGLLHIVDCFWIWDLIWNWIASLSQCSNFIIRFCFLIDFYLAFHFMNTNRLYFLNTLFRFF